MPPPQFASRVRLTDGAVAVIVLALGWPSMARPDLGTRRWAVGLALTLGIAGLMFVRRRWPVPVIVVVTLLTAVQLPLELQATPVTGLLAATWTAANERERRVSLPAAALAGMVTAVLAAAYGQRPGPTSLVLVAALVCAAWALGAYSRARRQVVAGLRERADRLERDRHLQAETAVAQERARIVRDMHDVLGHSLSVIAVQSEAARSMLGVDLQRSAHAMDQVARVAREALAEMRTIVRAERGRDPGALVVTPDLSGLAALVEAARDAGTTVRLTLDADVPALSPSVSAAGYRVVQESLTNIRKHAGTPADATVEVVAGTDLLRVEVRSWSATSRGHLPLYPVPDHVPEERGRSQAGPAGSQARWPQGGTGLLAMRERVSLLGGTLAHGWAEDGSFQVRAVIPMLAATSDA